MSKADKLKAIKGMNDVLPGHKDSFWTRMSGGSSSKKVRRRWKAMAIGAFSRQSVNPLRSFIGVWATQPISYRKRCTRLKTGVAGR